MSREHRDDERRDAGCEIRDAGYGIRVTRFTARIPNHVSRILKSFMNNAGWNNSLKVVMLTLLLEEELYQ